MTKEITPALLEEIAVKLDDWGTEFEVDRTGDGLATEIWLKVGSFGGLTWRCWLRADATSVQEARKAVADRKEIDQEAEQAWRTQ